MEFRKIDNMIAYINEKENDLVLAIPGSEVKWGTIDANKSQVNVLRTCQVATKEEFIETAKQCKETPSKWAILLTLVKFEK